MTEPVQHILFGDSAAGTLRQTLRDMQRGDPVLCLHDDFSFGPIDSADPATRARWVDNALGIREWDQVTEVTPAFLEASLSPDFMPVAWFSRRDTHSYCGFLWWLSHLDDAPCRIIDVTDAMVSVDPAKIGSGWRAISPSSLNSAEMAPLIDRHDPLTPEDRSAYQHRWKQLVAENAPLRTLDDDGSLVSAPISHYDSKLLAGADEQWRKAAYIVGRALGCLWEEDLHQAGDLLLYARACHLAEAGALEWRGDMAAMRDCEMRLPTFGG